VARVMMMMMSTRDPGLIFYFLSVSFPRRERARPPVAVCNLHIVVLSSFFFGFLIFTVFQDARVRVCVCARVRAFVRSFVCVVI